MYKNAQNIQQVSPCVKWNGCVTFKLLSRHRDIPCAIIKCCVGFQKYLGKTWLIHEWSDGQKENLGLMRRRIKQVKNVWFLVWCASKFSKDPTCHRQSSSGNSCPGGGYVNKQHTHTHVHANKQRGLKNRKHTYMQVHLTICQHHHLLDSLPNQQNTQILQLTCTQTRACQCTHTDTHMYTNVCKCI